MLVLRVGQRLLERAPANSSRGNSRSNRDSTSTVSNTFSYLAYGLSIRAAMPLPELVVGEAEEDVSIRFGRVAQPLSETSESGWSHFSPAPKKDYLFWRGVGSFLVRGGREIIVDPSPGLDERMLRLFVLGPILAVLLRQRGYLLLHASAVAVANEGVLFLGSSGWGKSTMAAALHSRGHALVTDDVAVLRVEENGSMVFPAFPQLKLWPEALVSLGDEPEKLPRWNPYFQKRARSASHKFPSTPLPIKRLYVLSEGDTTEMLPLRPQEAFMELVRHTYGSDYGLQTAMGVGSTSHFLQCTTVANKVAVCSLRRQKSLSQLPDLSRLVEKDLAQGLERGTLGAG